MSIPLPPSGAKPDLVFYYSSDPDNTTVTLTPLGTYGLLQTRGSTIYAEKEMKTKIGTFSSINTYTDIINPDINGLYPTVGPNVYFLPQGYIQIANNIPRTKDPVTGQFSNPPGIYTYGIDVGCSYGNFLNATGFVNVDSTLTTRVVSIYFNKPLLLIGKQI